MRFELHGRTAMITGASGGIGYAVSAALAAGGPASSIVLDVRHLDQAERVMAAMGRSRTGCCTSPPTTPASCCRRCATTSTSTVSSAFSTSTCWTPSPTSRVVIHVRLTRSRMSSASRPHGRTRRSHGPRPGRAGTRPSRATAYADPQSHVPMGLDASAPANAGWTSSSWTAMAGSA